MNSKYLILAIPFLIWGCSDTGEADRPIEVETPATKVEDGTETDLDTLPNLEDTIEP